jgi:hypothetical protein
MCNFVNKRYVYTFTNVVNWWHKTFLIAGKLYFIWVIVLARERTRKLYCLLGGYWWGGKWFMPVWMCVLCSCAWKYQGAAEAFINLCTNSSLNNINNFVDVNSLPTSMLSSDAPVCSPLRHFRLVTTYVIHRITDHMHCTHVRYDQLFSISTFVSLNYLCTLLWWKSGLPKTSSL